jgi:predicted nucleic acid-binding protein
MMVLVDTSVWIDYFRDGNAADMLEYLIDENLVVTNELIIAEMMPPLYLRKENDLVTLLECIECQPMKIDWKTIIQMQVSCISNGVNGIGIPALLIAQNAIDAGVPLYTIDKHFKGIAANSMLKLYEG